MGAAENSVPTDRVPAPAVRAPHATSRILLTSERGDKLSEQGNVRFQPGKARGIVIELLPQKRKQVLLGIGTSMTESSAFVLAHLEPDVRQRVMRDIFGRQGADFSMSRVPIGSCDFCVEGRYCYVDATADRSLDSFSVSVDEDGFDSAKYPAIRDASYDLLPMIQEALAIKREQGDESLKIIASAWTAPPWMKDIDDWFITADAANDNQGHGATLLAEHHATYADYLDRYLSAYRQRGVSIWAITPVNEPLGNGGNWESMHFSAASENRFVRDYLGPRLRQGSNSDVQVLIYDHNRDDLEQWCQEIYSDRVTSDYVAGAAVHWYESSFRVNEAILQRVHERFPDKLIVHSEGCIDCLGVDAPAGVTDPEGYKESGWFDNDAFWWNDNATDYAYSVTWPGIDADDHPKYTPVHRYARNIIVSLNHWVAGWVDWNIVLDQRGGPNHVGNFCGAPIMIDTQSGDIYYTPLFYVLAQFSRAMRPGDQVIECRLHAEGEVEASLYCCATINATNQLWVHVLNTAKQPRVCELELAGHHARIEMPANALQSIQIQLMA
jgi:glucosylceramidase